MNNLNRTQNTVSWIALISEISHVFCCVLPTMFSVMTVLVGMGVIGVMPIWIESLHDVMHGWEIPVIIFSGVTLLLGWTIHAISKYMDCRSTGCAHPPCTPKKKKNSKVLLIATILFAVNVTIYTTVHYKNDPHAAHAADHHHDEHDH